MNNIRKNNEQEEKIIEATFKLSPGAFVFFICGLVVFGGLFVGILIAAITLTGEVFGHKPTSWMEFLPFLIIFGIIFLGFVIIEILKLIGIKKSQFVVTNKRIYGTYHILIARKAFSYRLDEIDNIEMVSSLGQHTLAIQFTQGHGPTMPTTYVNGIPTSGGFNMFRISNIKNYKEMFEELNSLLTSHKNIIDVQTDIEMGKLDAENRKADALENVAKNIAGANLAAASTQTNNDNYINELRELKKLFDDGIITQEEFEKEKKEILENNHR